MSKLSKTAKAAAKAVEKSAAKPTGADRTDLQVIADVRRLLEAGLAVPPADQRFLLTKYDDIHALMVQNTELRKSSTAAFELVCYERDQALAALNQALTAKANLQEQVEVLTQKNQEFRDVYEQENRSQTLRVDVLEPTACGTLTETIDGFGN